MCECVFVCVLCVISVLYCGVFRVLWVRVVCLFDPFYVLVGVFVV